MPRISGITIPENKRIVIAITYIYGIGRPLSKKILKEANVSEDVRTKDLSSDEFERIRTLIEKNYLIEGELRRSIAAHIRRLKEIGTYRGARHLRNLPVRGQQTRTNARTKRGKRRTAGSGRRKTLEKT